MNYNQIKEILRTKTVGIAGCGGLGSNCAVALARVGVGNLIVVDFDSIEESNLNRQYYFQHQVGQKKATCLKGNVYLINSEVQVDAHDLKLNNNNIPEIFQNCDVIVEAFDGADMKNMLIESAYDHLPDIPIVMGLGMAGWGDSNSIHMRKSDNIYICGDEQKEVSEMQPPLAPRVGIVANMQANTVLEILLQD